MNKYSIAEILEMAVQTERLGGQFYLSMSDTFKKNADLGKLFGTLAAKEKIHEKTFAELKEIVTKSGPEPSQWEDVSDYLRAFVESEFFLGKGKALPSMERVRTAQDAVNFALGFEKETLLYYMELRSIVREKKVMDEIINEEKSHIVWLQRLKSSLKK